jgi:hypothetical protein
MGFSIVSIHTNIPRTFKMSSEKRDVEQKREEVNYTTERKEAKVLTRPSF